MSIAPPADGRQLRPRRRWWILLTVILLIVAGTLWLRSSRLDPRLVGTWTFLDSGMRRFLTLSHDGTAHFESVRPGQITPTPVANTMHWWVEDNLIVTQRIPDFQTAWMHIAEDTIQVVRLKKRKDRADFRLRIISADSNRLRIREVTTGVVSSPEIEMTRVEKVSRK